VLSAHTSACGCSVLPLNNFWLPPTEEEGQEVNVYALVQVGSDFFRYTRLTALAGDPHSKESCLTLKTGFKTRPRKQADIGIDGVNLTMSLQARR
jgi:hypothetical protein